MPTQITTDYMMSLSKGLNKLFHDALGATSMDYLKIATDVKINTMSMDYQWIEDMPMMREWIGDRELKRLKASSYVVSSKKWEASVSCPSEVIEYDEIGIMRPKILSLAQSVDDHYEDLIFSLLEKNATCYDGKNFFDQEHTVGSAKFSNLSNLELNQVNFLKTRDEMRALVSPEGRPLRIRPNLLVIHPRAEAKAIDILKKTTIANGETNTTYAMAEYLVADWLKDDKAWYLFDTSKPIKPLILQISKPVKFSAMDNPFDEAVFLRDEYRYGIDTRDNAGYGLWQLAYKNKPA